MEQIKTLTDVYMFVENILHAMSGKIPENLKLKVVLSPDEYVDIIKDITHSGIRYDMMNNPKPYETTLNYMGIKIEIAYSNSFTKSVNKKSAWK